MKKHLHELLRRGDFDGVADLAGRKRRVLGLLISLTFDPDPLIGWRAVEAIGAAAQRLAEEDPQSVRELLRRLHWLLSEESGGVCWRAPEAIAEIVRRSPRTFGDYAAIVVSLLREMAEEDLAHFRAGILWAIARLGPRAVAHLDAVLPAITACLDHADPQVRGMAAWCLGQCGHAQLLAGRRDLLRDTGPVDLYRDGQLVRTSVGELAKTA